MATDHAVDEAVIRRRIDELIEAVCGRDLEGLRSVYAPDVVSFDVQEPMQRVGAEAKLDNWTQAFAAFEGRLGYEVRDLTLTVGDDVAFAHALGRLSGTTRDGVRRGGFWVRATWCMRKIDGTWLVVHDHASVPIDLQGAMALMSREA